MYELELAGGIVGRYYYAHVAYGSAAAAAGEEYQVALAEIPLGHFHTLCGLHARSRADLISELTVYIAREAGAIERLGALGSVNVGLADVLLGLGEKIVDHAAVLLRLGGNGGSA